MLLRTKIPLVAVLCAAFLLTAGLFGLYRVHASVQALQGVMAGDLAHNAEAHELVIDFGAQVQAWKNVLLRGRDETLRRAQWAAFEKAEQGVKQRARRLREALPADHAARPLVQRFLQSHDRATAGFRQGLEAFRANGADAMAGDTAVQGLEQEPAELLEQVSRALEVSAEAQSQAAARDSTRDALASVSVMAVFAVVGGAGSVVVTRRALAPLQEAVRVAERVAQGDLGAHIDVRTQDEVGRLLLALQAMNDGLRKVVSQVRSGSDSIATASQQIAAGNAHLSQRTEEQAANLQQTAASMEQLASVVRSNAETAGAARELAGSASQVAAQGGAVVARVVSTMEEISTGSRKIAEIIAVIDGIAFQTNILALNAAVEAARAGEQGRGFAVVAGEVRTLAGRSAEAARQIRSLIGASVEQVEAGCDLVTQAGRTMQDIVGQVDRVSQLIGEISTAAQEQTSGIVQVSDAVAQLDQVTQQNAALVEQAAAAAESLNEQARRMVGAVGVFRLAPA